MQLHQLGRSDLQVAQLCLGGNVFGWSADEATSFAVLDAYAEAGGNFVDTADTYSRWLSGLGPRVRGATRRLSATAPSQALHWASQAHRRRPGSKTRGNW